MFVLTTPTHSTQKFMTHTIANTKVYDSTIHPSDSYLLPVMREQTLYITLSTKPLSALGGFFAICIYTSNETTVKKSHSQWNFLSEVLLCKHYTGNNHFLCVHQELP